jgi:sensor histidine kinase YesM
MLSTKIDLAYQDAASQKLLINFAVVDASKISRPKFTVAIHVAIWAAVIVLPFFFFTTPSEHYGRIGPVQCSFWTLATLLHIGIFYLNALFLYQRLLKPGRWWIYVLSIIALVLIVYNTKIFIVNTWFPALEVHEGVFRFAFFPTVFFVVISTIYRLVVDKIVSERTKSARKAEQLTSELKFLRSQISPHFLFNVLNNLVSMARHKSDQLEPSLIKLSGLMRYMLYESDERKVEITKEIEYLKSYIELQKLRFEEDIKITSDIQYDAHESHTIEPMLLIPFVENAFKHGATLVSEPFIRIALRITGSVLQFDVANKFGNVGNSKDRNSGIGLANVQARLNLLYRGAHQLTVEENNNIFNVHLSLQLR